MTNPCLSLLFFYQGKKYNFDKVLRPEVTQLQVYEAAAKSIVEGRMNRKV